MTLVWAVVAGLAVGLVLGALGGGGAILTIPVLTYVLGMGVTEATTASLVVVGLSSLVAVVAHARAGRVDWARGLVFAAVGAVGAVAGSFLSRGLDPQWLMVSFGVLLVVVALLMLRRGGTPHPDAAPADLRDPRRAALTGSTGLGVGVLTGFFGVGGGFAIVPALTLVLGLAMPTAAATSLLVIALNSAAALVTKLSLGVQLDWTLVAALTAATMVGSLAGTRIAGRADPRALKRAFAFLLVCVGIYTVVSSALALAA